MTLPDWFARFDLADKLGAAAIPIATFLLGHFWGWFSARRRFTRRIFLDRVNVSLNVFHDGTLKIRTITERPIEEVFPNQYVRQMVLREARRTTADRAILRFPPNDARFALDCIINLTAGYFVHGPIRQDLLQTVPAATYVVCLTCEPYSELRQQKIRAVLVRQDALSTLPETPATEKDWHADRVRTLQQIAQLYASEPQNFALMEICA